MSQQMQVEPNDEQTAMKPDERFDFSAIIDRPPLRLPGGARMVVLPVVNIEEWEITRPMPRQVSNPPGGVSVVPDIQNWSWHEYGMRVGIWRIMEVLTKHGIRASPTVNSDICEFHPEIIAEAVKLGWELVGHNKTNSQRLNAIPPEQERELIHNALDRLQQASGKRPVR